jgi:CubicO group peptidase (beta-lactamase class C family)
MMLQVNALAQNAAALEEHLRTQQPAIRSLLVLSQGAPVFEFYREGLGPQTKHNVYSVTKSVVSLLVGIAIDQGHIRGTDETLAQLFPELEASQSSATARGITLAHLLTLSTGFDHSHVSRETDYGEFQRRFYAPGLLAYALGRRTVDPPGSRFYYSNLDSHLVALAVAKRVNQSVAAYAQQHLFMPLGITDYAWEVNAHGQTNGASELQLSARDMAKIGQLVLQRGLWDGKQLVSAQYIDQATRRHVASDVPPRSKPELWGYGYLWWTATTPNDDLPAFYAAGYGGQFIYLVPQLKAVIVATTDAQSRAVAARTGAVLRDFVLPSLSRSARTGLP